MQFLFDKTSLAQKTLAALLCSPGSPVSFHLRFRNLSFHYRPHKNSKKFSDFMRHLLDAISQFHLVSGIRLRNFLKGGACDIQYMINSVHLYFYINV